MVNINFKAFVVVHVLMRFDTTVVISFGIFEKSKMSNNFVLITEKTRQNRLMYAFEIFERFRPLFLGYGRLILIGTFMRIPFLTVLSDAVKGL